MNGANDYWYVKYLCEHVPGGLLGPVCQLTDEELEALMPWSNEYKAYEKHEIETRYDAITLGNDMMKPTKADFQEIRRQMKEENSAAVETHDSSEKSEMSLDGRSDAQDGQLDVPVGQPDAPDSLSDAQDGQPDATVEGDFNLNMPTAALAYENGLLEMPVINGGSTSENSGQNKPPADQQNDSSSDFQRPEEQRKTG